MANRIYEWCPACTSKMLYHVKTTLSWKCAYKFCPKQEFKASELSEYWYERQLTNPNWRPPKAFPRWFTPLLFGFSLLVGFICSYTLLWYLFRDYFTHGISTTNLLLFIYDLLPFGFAGFILGLIVGGVLYLLVRIIPGIKIPDEPVLTGNNILFKCNSCGIIFRDIEIREDASSKLCPKCTIAKLEELSTYQSGTNKPWGGLEEIFEEFFEDFNNKKGEKKV